MLVAVLVWLWAGVFGSGSHTPLPEGWTEAEGVVLVPSRDGRHGRWSLVAVDGRPVLLELGEEMGVSAGDRVSFSGFADGRPGVAAGRGHRGAVEVTQLRLLASDSSLTARAGAVIRKRVLTRTDPMVQGRALLAGFLIGETGGLEESDLEAMRRSGLAHFVAVSGSNVALFLGLVFIAAGPLATGPRRRALLGLAALPVYAAATGFEPSVMRAAVMAGVALAGRLVGVVFETWQLLSLAVVLALVAQPDLAGSLGFQLSVAATAGVVAGARWPLPKGRVRRALAVTLGAQLAVAPLLLAAFGSVPVLSPLANLLAAPLVAASTVIGAIGIVGPVWLIDIAARLADVVLWVARGAGVWPQIGSWTLLLMLTLVMAGRRFPSARPVIATAGVSVLLILVLGIGHSPPDPGVIVLDVGQGDAILIHGGDHRFALVDGGPDQTSLIDGLRRYRVSNLEIVVLTHVHADHATGLIGLADLVPVGQVWADLDPHSSEASDRALAGFDSSGIPVLTPEPGHSHQLGDLLLEVEAPKRVYASPNDQSLVVTVRGPSETMLLAGDIETIAQAELFHLRADVLKVPHQGAATSDPEWLEAVGSELAVISVGPNRFGHPSPWVIEMLQRSGARVVRTDEVGDVMVPLG